MSTMFVLTTSFGQGWQQGAELGVAFILTGLIGLERDLRHKAAGVRTYTIVGLGAALFMLVSKYGFFDVVQAGTVSLDPSRVAAQIVSGVGFIGAGIIFVRRNTVQGITTAASVWLAAAIGAASGAGLIVLAVATTVAYFVALWALAPLATWVRRKLGRDRASLLVEYADGRGILREILARITEAGFSLAKVDSSRLEGDTVALRLEVGGRVEVSELIGELISIDGVRHVQEDDGEA